MIEGEVEEPVIVYEPLPAEILVESDNKAPQPPVALVEEENVYIPGPKIDSTTEEGEALESYSKAKKPLPGTPRLPNAIINTGDNLDDLEDVPKKQLKGRVIKKTEPSNAAKSKEAADEVKPKLLRKDTPKLAVKNKK